MKSSLIFFVVFLILASSCKNESSEMKPLLTKVDVNGIISGGDTVSINKINIASFIPLNFDSMVIVRPYIDLSEIEKFEFKNFHNIKSTLESINLVETKCALLFVRGNSIKGYCISELRPLDFTDFDEEVPVIANSEALEMKLIYRRYKNDKYYVLNK